MYSRLGNGFKSNNLLIKQTNNSRYNTLSTNSSRISLFQSVNNRSKDITLTKKSKSKSKLHSNQTMQNQRYQQSSTDTMERFISNIQRVLEQYTDLSIIIKGQLNSIIKIGRNIIKGNRKQNKQNIMDYNNISIKRDISQQKSMIIDRLKTQSQIQTLMQKLIKSKEKRAKLADENFSLKNKIQQLNKRELKLRKLIQNQNELIQSCVKEIDRLKQKTVDNSQLDQDLLSMLTMQAEQLEKALKNNKSQKIKGKSRIQ